MSVHYLGRAAVTEPEHVARLRGRIAALEATLATVWDNACADCGRPLHPRATACDGCALDRERAASAIASKEARRGE